MSLEATIQENTNAIRELIAAISKGMPVAASTVAAVVEQGKTTTEKAVTTKKSDVKTASSQPGAEQKSEAPKGDAQGTAEPAADNTAPADGGAVNGTAATYSDAAAAVTALAKAKGRDAAVAVLKDFGAAKLPDIKPEDFAAVIAACEKAATAEQAEA